MRKFHTVSYSDIEDNNDYIIITYCNELLLES